MKHKGIKKLYYSISEISEMLDIKQSVIRYWEGEFKILNPQKNRAGNRIYKKDDIPVLRLIHYYVHGKHLSIQETREMIDHLKKEGLYKRKINELNALAGEEKKESPEGPEKDRKTGSDEEETSVQPFLEEIAEKTTPERSGIRKEPEKTSADEESLIFPADEDIAREKEAVPEKAAAEGKSVDEKEQTSREVEKDNTEMRELLQKISANIRDIIDILNESRKEEDQ
ncbi:MAG: MerR family transcriptional regulator [Candidatus Marinimicrobia bacterium]|nr:MerR family transcriptional regulator [Candidatus Neomarinimicrobiota bacterium]